MSCDCTLWLFTEASFFENSLWGTLSRLYQAAYHWHNNRMKREGKFRLNRLRKYRRLMGYEQGEVAVLLGMKNHTRISKWEQGICRPSMEYLFRLSILYRTLPDELFYDLRQEFVKDMRERIKILQGKRDQGG